MLRRADVVAAVDDLMRPAAPDGVGHAICRMMNRPDTTAELAAFHAPVAVVAGEEDTLMPPAEAAAMAASVRGSAFVRIPGAGHLPGLEAPDVFNRAMGALLARVEAGAA